jgi:hypothetical protein
MGSFGLFDIFLWPFDSDKVIESKNLTEKNLLDVVWPYLDRGRYSVHEFVYKEGAFEHSQDNLGRGVIKKILEDEFLTPSLMSNGKIVTRGKLGVYKSGKMEVDAGLYRILGYDILVPLNKSIYFNDNPVKN